MDKIDWVILTKVPDLIIRGALINRLGEEQIEVYAPDRDVIVNLNSTTPNLSLEGYSALFDGYEVYVPKQNLERAKKIWEEHQAELYKPSNAETDHPQKFYSMAVMSFILPIVTHYLAFYHWREGIKKNQKFSKIKIFFSILVMIPSGFLAYVYALHLWDQIKILL